MEITLRRLCVFSVSVLPEPGNPNASEELQDCYSFFESKPEKKKPQPQVLLLGRGSVNLPLCDRVSSPLRICHQLRHLQLLLWQRLEPSEPGDRGGRGSWGQTMLIGMGEWRGTLNFLVCGRS